jgi:hypothetical protein
MALLGVKASAWASTAKPTSPASMTRREPARSWKAVLRTPSRIAATADSPKRSYQAVYHHDSGMTRIGSVAGAPTSRYHRQARPFMSTLSAGTALG